MVTAVLVTVACLGLVIGSFLNAAIYRLPRECMSVIRQARSFCPRCGVQLAWFDNVPILSYCLWLRGRCRSCKKPISWRYPTVEALTAVAFVALVWHDVGPHGLGDPALAVRPFVLAGVHALVFCVLLVLAAVDLDYRILPDALTIPGLVAAPFLAAALPEIMPRPLLGPFSLSGAPSASLTALVNGLVGAVVGGGGLWLIGWLGSIAFRKPAMGFGDVKLMAAMGGLLGLWVPLALVVASFAGALIGVVILLFKKDHYLPFGPFLALGMMVSLLWGPEVFDSCFGFLTRHGR